MEKNWKNFFNGFSLFRTSLIQENYINTIKKYVPSGGSILEIAAGSGLTSVLLSDMGYEVTCTDIDDDLLKNIRSKFKSFNMKVEKCDMFQANSQYNNQQFDCIIHQGLLEHFSDIEIIEIITQQKDLAHYLIFDIPNDKRVEKIQEYGNERFLSTEYWINLFERADCVVLDVEGRRFEDLLEKNKYSLSKEERLKYGTSNTFVIKSKKSIPKKLHYGCGTVYLDGWFNVDAQIDFTSIDKKSNDFLSNNKTTPDEYYKFDFSTIDRKEKKIVGDFEAQIEDLAKILPNHFEEVIIYHVIEHIPKYKVEDFFENLLNCSKSDCLFRFAVPDNIGLSKLYLEAKDDERSIYHDYIFGKQRDAYSHHFVGYDEKSFTKTLSKYFSKIKLIENGNDYPALWVLCEK